MNFKRLDDFIAWPKVAEDDLVQLLETNVSGVLTEALPAHVQVVFPDHSVAVAAGAALPGALSVLPWATEPNVIVTHLGFWEVLDSETKFSFSWASETEVRFVGDNC